jgi:diguanylate cyclase (GGDEF)-like protein/PAS domain S-box-containing protein
MSTWPIDDRAFAALFIATPNCILALDERARIIASNASSAVTFGYDERELAGKDVRELVRDANNFFEEALEAAQTRRSMRSAMLIRRKNGELLPAEVTSIPITDRGGGAELFVVLQERAAPNDEIAQLRSNFQLLFEHNPAVVVAINPQRTITDINPAGLRYSGYSRDQIVGQDFTAFIPAFRRNDVLDVFHRTLAGETVAFDLDAYTADHRLVHYEATALPILTHNAVAGIYALLENVTDRLRAERTVAAQRAELLDLEHDFRSLFDRNPDGIVLLSGEGVIIDVNEPILKMSRRSRDEIVGQHFRGFLQGDDLERGWSSFRQALAGEPVRYEITSSRGDASELVLDVTLFPKYAQGIAVGVYCVMQDITERRIAQRKLEMQTQRIRDLYLLATAPEYTDAQVISTLQTGCRLLGMESGAIIDATGEPHIDIRYDSLELFAGEDAQVLEIARDLLRRRESVASNSGEQFDGGYASWIGSRLMVAGALHGVLLFFSHTGREQEFEEIDRDTLALMSALVGSALERRRTRSHLRTLAYYDALTGLPNRLFFNERLRDALLDSRGHAHSMAVLFFDLDRFKDINDTLGHAMGDRFLQMVAQRLLRAVGDRGVVARMGGDEFIVLLQECGNNEEVLALAQRLLRIIDEPYRLEGYEQFITTSIGIAMYPDDGRDDQTLIKHADIAMYQAKERGGNAFVFYRQALEAPLRNRLQLERRLRRGLERDQFLLHYQPIVDVHTETPVAFEALVRWNDPQRGTVFPDEFIPTAEASGFIVQLGEWTIEHAARQMRAWQERFGDLTIAVNISARQFHQPDLARRLQEILTRSGLDPRCLEVEITETMALSDVSHAIDTVRQLKAIGARIAVDDFGTGHSSLSYLRRFEVDHIKIDRSFVAGIGSERSDQTIVKAIIAMGHSLGLGVVAEGVETRAQYEFLRAHHCDRVQGYLFSRPVEAAAAEALIPKMRGTGALPG